MKHTSKNIRILDRWPGMFKSFLLVESFAFRFFVGVFSVVLSFFVSPYENLVSLDLTGWLKIGELSIWFGCGLSLSSAVNGYSLRMLNASRLDYYVNIFVASLFGLSVAALFLFILKYQLIGRWVFFNSVVTNSLLLITVSELMVAGKQQLLCVGGSGVDRLISTLNEYGLTPERSGIGVNRCTSFVSEVVESVLPSSAAVSEYVVQINDCTNNRGTLDSCDDAIGRMSSVDGLVERVFSLVTLQVVAGKNWWDYETNLRFTAFEKVKRGMDLVLGIGMLICAVPVIAIAGLIVKMADSGPVFYSQIRLGRYGVPFRIYKIRSMRIDSEKTGAQWAKKSDPRVTWFGLLLRRSRLDELPQLWNIVKGDMSLIGPRPERPEICSMLRDVMPEFDLRLAAKPGLTGWAQVNYPYGASIDDSKIKLAYDLYYLKNAGVLLDIRIMTRTVVAMVKGAR